MTHIFNFLHFGERKLTYVDQALRTTAHRVWEGQRASNGGKGCGERVGTELGAEATSARGGQGEGNAAQQCVATRSKIGHSPGALSSILGPGFESEFEYEARLGRGVRRGPLRPFQGQAPQRHRRASPT